MFSHYLTAENVNLWSQNKISPDTSVVLNKTITLLNCIPWINTRSYWGHYPLFLKSRYSLRWNQVPTLENMIVQSTWPDFTPWRYQFTIFSLASQHVSYRAVNHSCIRKLRQQCCCVSYWWRRHCRLLRKMSQLLYWKCRQSNLCSFTTCRL